MAAYSDKNALDWLTFERVRYIGTEGSVTHLEGGVYGQMGAVQQGGQETHDVNDVLTNEQMTETSKDRALMTIINKAASFFGVVAALTVAMPLAMAEGDPAVGEKVFKKCKACHVVDKKKNRLGPHLIGLFGRTSGTVEGFEKKYSKAMKEAAIIWDEATLNDYLADPKGYIPKNKMAFKGLSKDEDRANVIAYLKEVSAE